MPPHLHSETIFWEFPIPLTIALLLTAWLYLRGWIYLRVSSPDAIPAWRALSYFLGLLLVAIALESPLAAYDHNLLTVHMIKHLLLMTVAPALILLGEPVKVFRIGMPALARLSLRRALWRPTLRQFARLVTNPVLCWTVSALTLVIWHIPAVLTLGVRSATWHTIEQAMFLGAGLLFWWPVIQPWPSASSQPRWSMLVYLFLATLPCDILSGFLAFSDRVAYPVYLSTPRLFGFSVIEDQQCAAAVMWTCVTLIYLVPAAIISTKLLAPRISREHDLRQPQSGGGAVAQSAPRSVEVV
jgi:putative membrane protein